MKPFLLDQACAFIREQTKAVAQNLTRAHHAIISQFIHFKHRTDDKIEEANKAIKQKNLVEVALA